MRLPRALALALGFFATATLFTTFAQPGGGLDKIYYIDRKTGKTVNTEGELKESPAGVQVLVNGKAKLTISPADVVRMEYTEMPGITGDDRGTLLVLESEKDATKARVGFSALKKKGQGERTKRYLEYRELQSWAKQTDSKTGEDYRKEASLLADAWGKFAAAYPKGWEVWPALKSQSRLLVELGEPAKAADALDTLAKTAGLPKDLKVEATLARADALLRAKNNQASSLLATLSKDPDVPATGTLREKLNIYLAWAAFPAAPAAGQPAVRPDDALVKMQAAIDAAKDPIARATGFNAKGELFLSFGLPRDAMWEFLWVETVYFQDKDETLKAVTRLIDVFEKLGDKDRADQYREKLKKLKG